MLMIYIMFSSLFIMILMIIWKNLLSNKFMKNREKMSSYECGFNPFYSPRINFSFNFFTISILFILFDIEVALMLPMLKLLNFNNYMYINNLLIMIIFMFFLTSLFEWMFSMILLSKKY